MSQFLYKFDSIKKTKDILEKKVQKELADIDIQIENLSDEFVKLEKKKENSVKNLQQYKRVSDLKQLDNYRNNLKQQMEVVKKKIDLLTLKRENKLDELIIKSQESKMFRKLEEVHLEEYNHEENIKEEKIINEVATQKFIRGNN